MNRYFGNLSLALLLAAVALPLSADSTRQVGQQVFVGEVTDAICGVNKSHTQMMNSMSSMGREKDTCTKQCIRLGVGYMLFDPVARTAYHLDEPAKAQPFAGRRVRIAGALEDNKIKIATIEAAN